MFQWNQTYVINSVKDTLSGLDKVQNIVNGKNHVFRVLRVADFDAAGITAAYKNPYKPEVNGKVSIKIDTSKGVEGDVYRIKLYVRLSGSNNSYYANDFVFKGKPFVYEFKHGQTAADIAKLIKEINNLYDDKFLKVYDEGESVVFEGDNYTMFVEASVEKYGAEDYSLTGGTWTTMYDINSNNITVTKCENGFGTFTNVLKDLRLPTLDNTNWTSSNMEEMPIPGAKYNQYTIEYCKQVGVQGTAHVGDLVTAKTTHSFYVNEVVSDFETLLNEALTNGGKGVTLEEVPAKAEEENTEATD